MSQSAHAAFRNTTSYSEANASITCVYSSSSHASYTGSPGRRHVGHDGNFLSRISFIPSWLITTSGEKSRRFCQLSLDRSSHHEQCSATSRYRPSGNRRTPPRDSGQPGMPKPYTSTSPRSAPHVVNPAASPSAIESPTTATLTLDSDAGSGLSGSPDG